MSRISVRNWISSIADRGRELLDLPLSTPQDSYRPLANLCRDLVSQKGEARGTALAREVVRMWENLPATDHLKFFEMMQNDFSAKRDAVIKAADAYKADPTEANLAVLTLASEPARQELLRRINMAPGGTRAIVDMREALIDLLKTNRHLEPLNADMQHLLMSWFNRGFLELRHIDWDTSAAILEKLIRYEAVHEIKGWDDLRRRLAQDRKCFAFFHPAIPDDPLIFVEVALVHGLADSVQALLEPEIDIEAKTRANTAIFYSISNCQEGLKGISFGNFLIKQVVEELKREFPQLTVFATLSPIPGFMGWLRTRQKSKADDADQAAIVLDTMSNDDWINDPERTEALKRPAMQLCARYLSQGQRGKSPLDPTARFHLGNGARLERLNWLGDISTKGLRQSGGIMVNYAYRLDEIERNHEALVNDGKIAASRSVLQLAGN
ncbi:malonyl-CoA decarboxylase [Thalassospira sp.]|uniref:malonyl-CoA decarboxylase n=1 Tax=Thalassospira sp. TaxID=1912094 RepID=UPI002734A7C8|nr:malonyl-CoA decarboxylase [Thalassospira sp.]MDP2696835.1 malonyl-CoA decarboxylase [Thalassospira sp.]